LIFIIAIPEDAINTDDVDEDSKINPDERVSIRASDKRVSNENELSDSEDEDGRKDQR
jgi:histone deacetylase 1/2